MKYDFVNHHLHRKNNESLNAIGSLFLMLLPIVILVLIPKTSAAPLIFPQPSNYQAYLLNYKDILENYDPASGNLRDETKISAQRALAITRESSARYPEDPKIVALGQDIKNQIRLTFPELLAQY